MELTEQQKQPVLLLNNMDDDEAIQICPWVSTTADLMERLQERGLAPTTANVAAVANRVNTYICERSLVIDWIQDAIEHAIDKLEQVTATKA